MGSARESVHLWIQPTSAAAGRNEFDAGARATSDASARRSAGGLRDRRRRTRPGAARRAGVVTLWLILVLPVLLMLLIFLIEIANVWRARVELENALEAAALAAVKEWKEGSTDGAARAVAITYAAANTVAGESVVITENSGGDPNGNASATGNLVFGAVTTAASPWVFHADTSPSCPTSDYGVRAQATVQVASVAARLGGYTVPVLWVSAAATARYACAATQPQLIRVRPENFIY